MSVVGLAAPAQSFSLAAPAAQQTQTHTVQAGETLFRIALHYGVTVEQLVSVNHLIDPSHILVGQVLIISGAAQPVGTGPNPPAVQPPAPAAPVYYVVQVGDTLNRIAQSYGVTAAAIMAANGLSNPNLIEVGQSLVIPGVSAPGGGATVPSQPAQPPTAPVPTSQPPTLLPPSAIPPTTQPPTVPPPPTPATPKRTYTVQAGQGLSQIAQLFGVTWPQIVALNNIRDPNTIYAGTVLQIPDSNIAPPTTMENSSGVPPGPLAVSASGKLIVVVLHEERVYIYQDGQVIRSVLVSTGLPGTPTVIGTFHIYVKYSAQLMVGPGYYLPGVPWVMYFYEGYGLHGTYWHHNWGHPMSHGCVNMPTDEALWLYNWAEVGTPVTVVA